jgi:hypothetical protein
MGNCIEDQPKFSTGKRGKQSWLELVASPDVGSVRGIASMLPAPERHAHLSFRLADTQPCLPHPHESTRDPAPPAISHQFPSPLSPSVRAL